MGIFELPQETFLLNDEAFRSWVFQRAATTVASGPSRREIHASPNENQGKFDNPEDPKRHESLTGKSLDRRLEVSTPLNIEASTGCRGCDDTDREITATQQAKIALRLARAYLDQSHLDEALVHVVQILQTVQATQDQDLRNKALQLLLVLLFVQGRFKELMVIASMKEESQSQVMVSAVDGPIGSSVAMLSAIVLRGHIGETVLSTLAEQGGESDGPYSSAIDVAAVHARMLVSGGHVAEARRILLSGEHRQAEQRLQTVRDLTTEGYLALLDASYGSRPLTMELSPNCSALEDSCIEGLRLITKLCVDMELAGATGEHKLLRVAYFAAKRAYSLGLNFTVGWPFCLPHVMARACQRLGLSHAAVFYLASAYHICLRNGAETELEAIEHTQATLFPEVDLDSILTPAGTWPHTPWTTCLVCGMLHSGDRL
jgi:hypothetical protein